MGTVSPIAIDLTAFLTDLKGDIVKDPRTGENVTMSECVVNALLQAENGQGGSYDEKAKRFKLAQKVSTTKDPITLELNEKELIKNQATKLYGPLIVGRIAEALYGQV